MAFFPNGISPGTRKLLFTQAPSPETKLRALAAECKPRRRLLIDQGTVISNNVAGTDGTRIRWQDGGGLYINNFRPPASGLTCDPSYTHVTITGNTATGNG